MWRIYQNLFDASQGKFARILACILIGGILATATVLKSEKPEVRAMWHLALVGGMVVGLLAGSFLMFQDHFQEKRAMQGLPERSIHFKVWWYIGIFVGIGFLVSVIGIALIIVTQ